MPSQFKSPKLVLQKLSGFSLITILILTSAIALVALIAYTNQVRQSSPSVSPPPRPPAPIVPKPSTPFNIESFYNRLQSGMTPDQVNKLAGKNPDNCTLTDSEPPSESCFWRDVSKSVTVNYGHKSIVQSKTKSGF